MSDLISRCELFNRLATIPAPPEANDLKAEIYKVIQSMETVEPKRGLWIGGRVSHSPGYICSICNFGVSPWMATKYCPNCGAIMEIK